MTSTANTRCSNHAHGCLDAGAGAVSIGVASPSNASRSWIGPGCSAEGPGTTSLRTWAVEVRRWDQCDQPRDEVQRSEHDSVRTVAPSSFEADDDSTRLGDGQAFVADGRSRHVPTQSFEALAIPTLDGRPDVYRCQRLDLADAVHQEGAVRGDVGRRRGEDRQPRSFFRAVLLTSVTTIVGLVPLMLETSRQAQMLIPVATSIVFGLAASTVLVLIVLPAAYVLLDDLGLLGGGSEDTPPIVQAKTER